MGEWVGRALSKGKGESCSTRISAVSVFLSVSRSYGYKDGRRPERQQPKGQNHDKGARSQPAQTLLPGCDMVRL